MEAEVQDYLKHRGKCKEACEALAAQDPSLTLKRGHYICPVWGEQAHWWLVDKGGKIVDPTKDQFPSRGRGHYVEFDGVVPCANCSKEMTEEEVMENKGDAHFEGNYAFCSTRCHCEFVGIDPGLISRR